MNQTRVPMYAYLISIYAFFYIPLLVLIVYSFNTAQYSLVWSGFTLDWYKSLFADRGLWSAALHSVLLAISSSTAATLLGTIAAVNLYRYQYRARKLQQSLIFVLILSMNVSVSSHQKMKTLMNIFQAILSIPIFLRILTPFIKML